ncbi:dihydrofolate reductase family protein [Nocardioides sp. zg-ZUI104]|uniref:dihydrofolate reductase family protein n=1 Tax=Nocardioides faecalis TaxID=2803858 RepID=UPI001BCB7945|nr:dihydrofolate reductase family protein [Nocardioides faecalis]MBS4753128.1 dihydrofolate reductase family protein [Nocardioides faecalis]
MGRLVYTAIGSLDGFVADASGDFSWAAPDEEVHAHVNERDQQVVAELYGRRLFEVMGVWETYGADPADEDVTEVERAYGAVWRERAKTVFSTTLTSVPTQHTRLERSFDPAAVRAYVDATDGDVSLGGPTLAAHALRAGIVDAVEYYAHPVVIGAGTRWLPPDLRLGLDLVTEHRFGCGVVHLAYDVRRSPAP